MRTLFLPRMMKVALLDGQHRQMAIEHAVRKDDAQKKESNRDGERDSVARHSPARP